VSAREEHIEISRTARIYVLADVAMPSDVWVVCHGYAQLASRFITHFEDIATPERLIVAPEGLHRFYLDPPPAPAANRRVGATWMTRHDRESDIRDYVAYLDRVVAHVTGGRRDVRIRALGFSQGSATVFRWAVLGNTQVDDLILWAGEVPPDVDMQRAATRLHPTRITYVRGSEDRMLPEAVALRQIELLGAAGLSCEVLSFDGGHELDAALLAAIAGAALD
jgi:predicted esterase